MAICSNKITAFFLVFIFLKCHCPSYLSMLICKQYDKTWIVFDKELLYLAIILKNDFGYIK